jgi:hypothetical protein
MVLVFLFTMAVNAGVGIGASVSGGSRFLCGGRISLLQKNPYFLQPLLEISFSPLPEKRLFSLGNGEFLQLREKIIFFEIGLLEQIFLSGPIGIEAELSLGIIEGWYNGSRRNFPTELVPVAAVGPVFRLPDNFRMIPRYKWCRIDSSNKNLFELILEVHF